LIFGLFYLHYDLEIIKSGLSQGAAEDIDDADEAGSVPLDGDRPVYFVVPEARAGYIESAVGLLHNDAVGDELEVLVDGGDVLEDLRGKADTSSQIWLVQTCASLTL
jgi:hypothetical protein